MLHYLITVMISKQHYENQFVTEMKMKLYLNSAAPSTNIADLPGGPV